MGDIVKFGPRLARKKRRARSEVKRWLRDWVNDLPDDICGFIACAISRPEKDTVRRHTYGAGKNADDRIAAQHAGVIRFMNYGEDAK